MTFSPAAADTLINHFKDTGRSYKDYDLILTGDLGVVGSEIFCDLVKKEGYDISSVHNDCGKMIFDLDKQDVHAGGSGCGCIATVFCGYIMEKFKQREISRILLMATGALMNTTMLQQGESIPSVAHCVSIER